VIRRLPSPFALKYFWKKCKISPCDLLDLQIAPYGIKINLVPEVFQKTIYSLQSYFVR